MEFFLTKEAVLKEYPFMWKLYKEYLPDLSDDEILIAIELALSICSYCREAIKPCHCWAVMRDKTMSLLE